MKYRHKCQIEHGIDDAERTVYVIPYTFVMHAILFQIPEKYFRKKIKGFVIFTTTVAHILSIKCQGE